MTGSATPAPEVSPAEGDLPQDLVGDRRRLLGIGMGAVFWGCAVFAVLRFAVTLSTGRATPWWANAGGAVAVALVYLWCRGDPVGRTSAGVHISAAIATFVVAVPVAYGVASSKWWLALVGFAVTLMGRRGEALVWVSVTVVIVPLAALLEPSIQVPNAAGEPPVEGAIAGFFFVVILMVLSLAFRRVADRRARELGETARSLARANAVKSRFLAHMSHEVRTPLHGVIAMTDMAMENETSPIVRQQIQTAQQSARVLLGLLNNVLEAARAESDAIEIENRPFLLHAALEEVLRPLAAQARAKGLSFTARAEPDLVEPRVGDRVRFMQIVLNVVSNALKFTQAGTIDVRLEGAGKDGRVALVVKDTGPGIAKEKLGVIFEAFVQANASDANVQGGAGLGLAIVRDLARRMDGDIRVESEPGRGATFTVELALAEDGPLPRPFGAEDLLAVAAAPSVMKIERAAKSLSILACEDNPVNQAVLRAMLERLGHGVKMVSDGAQAWELLETEHFDVLVTDIEMPGLDGVELTRRIRTREGSNGGARMPIIGATAHVGVEEQHRLLDAGMDEHLPKPFRLGDLATLLERVVRR